MRLAQSWIGIVIQFEFMAELDGVGRSKGRLIAILPTPGGKFL
jgi:hypothetical protein